MPLASVQFQHLMEKRHLLRMAAFPCLRTTMVVTVVKKSSSKLEFNGMFEAIAIVSI